jgi:amidase
MNDNENNSDKAAMSRREILGLAAGATVAAAVYASAGQAAELRANDIVVMDAATLTRAIHSRKVSCVEVMSAYLDHIERINPKVTPSLRFKIGGI